VTDSQVALAIRSDEERRERAVAVLEQMLRSMEVPATVEAKDLADGTISIAVMPGVELQGVTPGRRSPLGDALQYLVNKLVNRPGLERRWVSVGIGAHPEPRPPRPARAAATASVPAPAPAPVVARLSTRRRSSSPSVRRPAAGSTPWWRCLPRSGADCCARPMESPGSPPAPRERDVFAGWCSPRRSWSRCLASGFRSRTTSTRSEAWGSPRDSETGCSVLRC